MRLLKWLVCHLANCLQEADDTTLKKSPLIEKMTHINDYHFRIGFVAYLCCMDLDKCGTNFHDPDWNYVDTTTLITTLGACWHLQKYCAEYGWLTGWMSINNVLQLDDWVALSGWLTPIWLNLISQNQIFQRHRNISILNNHIHTQKIDRSLPYSPLRGITTR